jgi:hypothetical protein
MTGPELRAGARLASAVDTTEVVVVRSPGQPLDLQCGGHPMVPLDGSVDAGTTAANAATTMATVSPDHAAGTLLGKRYVDDAQTVEVLCTRPGEGSLSVGDEPMRLKEAKPLPASD